MEKLSRRFADLIAEKLAYDDEQAAVIAYGLLAVMQTLSMLILSSIIGAFFGCFLECFTVFFAAGFLRKYTGGVHSKTLAGCLIIALIIIGLLGYVARFAFVPLFENFIQDKLYLGIVFILPLYLLCFAIIKKLAPVESVNKPIQKAEKREKLNFGSRVTILIYLFISVLFLFLSFINIRFFTISIALLFASLWQTFTLTKFGHKFIEMIDFPKTMP